MLKDMYCTNVAEVKTGKAEMDTNVSKGSGVQQTKQQVVTAQQQKNQAKREQEQKTADCKRKNKDCFWSKDWNNGNGACVKNSTASMLMGTPGLTACN